MIAYSRWDVVHCKTKYLNHTNLNTLTGIQGLQCKLKGMQSVHSINSSHTAKHPTFTVETVLLIAIM